jgi:hypothetical protein
MGEDYEYVYTKLLELTGEEFVQSIGGRELNQKSWL